MLLFLYEDEHGWIYEPHGEEAICYDLTFDGSELLRAAGWRPYEMHRVSRHLHDSLLIDGLLTLVPSKRTMATITSLPLVPECCAVPLSFLYKWAGDR
jgi:hypothetical protein